MKVGPEPTVHSDDYEGIHSRLGHGHEEEGKVEVLDPPLVYYTLIVVHVHEIPVVRSPKDEETGTDYKELEDHLSKVIRKT